MKTWTLILILTTLSRTAWAHDTRHPSDHEERIRLLEKTVRDLQYEMDGLRHRRPVSSCLLSTPFGTFHGKGETMLEAKARTLNACEKASKAFCNEDKVVCEKN